MLARRCGIPVTETTGKNLRERLRDFQALLRGVEPEEGYEWPEGREQEEAQEGEEVAVDDR